MKNTVLTVLLLIALAFAVGMVLYTLESLKAAARKDCPTCYSIPARTQRIN